MNKCTNTQKKHFQNEDSKKAHRKIYLAQRKIYRQCYYRQTDLSPGELQSVSQYDDDSTISVRLISNNQDKKMTGSVLPISTFLGYV